LDKVIKYKKIINFAKAQRLGWYGQIERMHEAIMVKGIPSWKPISIKPTEKPNICCAVDVRKDMRRMNVPNWKTVVQDRKKIERCG
jgi:hypothetical protein